MAEKCIAEVAVPIPLFKTFHYFIPEELRSVADVGKRVIVPFRNRTVAGLILSFLNESHAPDIKPVLEVIDDEPVLSELMLKFLKGLSDYYLSPVGEVIKGALPFNLSRRITDWKKAKVIEGEDHEPEAPPELNNYQKMAFERIREAIVEGRHRVFLLFGVTGSGKTEVYMRAISCAIELGKAVIILVPEISLTPQYSSRFRGRFGELVAIIHSRMSASERFRNWLDIKKGRKKIIIGPRSSIFAPVEDLGLIIIDEEHDPSYKQEEGVRYHARDMGILRGRIWNIPVVLGSATPSVETYFRAKKGEFELIRLPERVEKRPLPDVEIVDLKKEEKKGFISERLKVALQENWEKRGQSLLFLNRRGFAPFLFCKDCGWSYRCPACSIPLTYHHKEKIMLCHYCNYQVETPAICPSCHGFRVSFSGAGTERIATEIKGILPWSRVRRMDRDSTRQKDSHIKIFEEMESGRIEILVGTQMITKGHDYPALTLVGVIWADMSLSFPDFRAGERTFQLLTQVAGRSGRGDIKGKVILQTYRADHPIILFARDQDYEAFYEWEIKQRKALGYPPFKTIALIRFVGKDEGKVLKIASETKQKALETVEDFSELKRDIELLGPAPCPYTKLRGKYRWQILIKAKNKESLDKFLRLLISDLIYEKHSGSVKIQVDIDPVNTL